MIVGLEKTHTSGCDAIRSGCILGRVPFLDERDIVMAVVEGARDEFYIATP